MRRLVLALILCLFTLDCYGFVGTWLKSVVTQNFSVATFEAGDDGYVASNSGSSTVGRSTVAAHSGTYSYSLTVGSAGTGAAAITKTITCRAGDITFWHQQNNSVTGNRLLIDGSPAWTHDGSGAGTWTKVTVAVTAGSHTIAFNIPSTSTYRVWYIDDISIPVP